MNQPEGLISVLLDKNARIDERDDAAIDLRNYDDEIALSALLRIVLDHDEDPILMETSGESVAVIWVRKNKFNLELYKKMHPQAQYEAKNYIHEHKPDWMSFFDAA